MKNTKAFSMMEIAIVLVIIALIVGGVMAGQELIKGSRAQAAMAQMQGIKSAKETFVIKNGGIPGDITNAQTIGVHRNSAGAITGCMTRTGPITYNGDGNGLLNSFHGGTYQVSYSGEIANFYFQLSNSGMIDPLIITLSDYNPSPGNYNCTSGNNACWDAGGDVFTGGEEYPLTKGGDGLIVLSSGYDGLHFVLGFGARHYWKINATTPGGNCSIAQNTLFPDQAMRIDSKLDDGMPTTGKVFVTAGYTEMQEVPNVSKFFGSLIVSGVTGATSCVHNGNYNVGYSQAACTLGISMEK